MEATGKIVLGFKIIIYVRYVCIYNLFLGAMNGSVTL